MDTSDGFYRRWMTLRFPNQFLEGKDVMDCVPEDEFEALACEVTKILPGIIESGQIFGMGTIEERKQKYILESNPLSIFIKRYCVKDETRFVKYSEIYSYYSKFLKVNKKRVISHKEFSKHLVEEGYEINKTTRNIDGVFQHSLFVESLYMISEINLVDFMLDVLIVHTFPLATSHIENKWENRYNEHNEHKNQNFVY